VQLDDRDPDDLDRARQLLGRCDQGRQQGARVGDPPRPRVRQSQRGQHLVLERRQVQLAAERPRHARHVTGQLAGADRLVADRDRLVEAPDRGQLGREVEAGERRRARELTETLAGELLGQPGDRAAGAFDRAGVVALPEVQSPQERLRDRRVAGLVECLDERQRPAVNE
jgi:hypothetical protein